MTKLEQRMYQVLGAISETNAPIIFMGGLITKLILAENGFTSFDRPTIDIDAQWISSPPTMDELVITVEQALRRLGGEFSVLAKRKYDDKQAAGLSIIETATGNLIVSMDVDIKPVYGSKTYYYGETAIKGVLPTEILADKISVLSSQYIFRRAKDLLDVYALAHCVTVKTTEIYNSLDKKGRILGSFEEFYDRMHELETAYNRLAGIEEKPLFIGVYQYLDTFIRPFAAKESTEKVWISSLLAWQDEQQ